MTRKVDKPWGYEIIWAHTNRYVGKLLFVRRGHKLSLQYHERKDETIYLHSGKMLFTVSEQGRLVEKTLQPGDAHRIEPGVRHRMEALEDCQVFEASTTELDDVVRLEDAYGRATLPPADQGNGPK